MYQAPLRDLRFVLHELLDTRALENSTALPDYSAELADSILTEAGRFAEQVLEPLNQSGDREGAHWSASGVTAAKGFKEAYAKYVEGGWGALGAHAEHGGQPVPQASLWHDGARLPGCITDVEDCEPEHWIGASHVRNVVALTEQVLAQSDDRALLLLRAEMRDDDERE